MAQHIIEVRVNEKIASVVGDPLYVCGNSDYVVKFSFDAEWAGHETKTARFIKSNKEYIDVVFAGDQCAVPIIDNTPYVRIGVFAGNLCTTSAAIVNAQRSILCGSGVPADPDPDVYAQMMARFDELFQRDVKTDSEKLGGKPASDYALKSETAPVSHVSDKNNPHGVTLEQIGAAPAGYGLGGAKSASWDTIDTVTAPGWYYISGSNTICGHSANYWYMFVAAYQTGSLHGMQTLYSIAGTGRTFVRFRNSGEWKDWIDNSPAALTNYSVASDMEVDNTLISAINSMGDQTFKRIVLSFTTTNNFTNGGGHYYVDIYKLSTNYAKINIRSYINGGKELWRNWYEGALQPWEWVNPSMSLGVEYRTTERWQGKVVYTKAINFGALPTESSKTVAHASAVNQTIIAIDGVLSDGCHLASGINKDRAVTDSGTITVDNTKWNIRVMTNYDFSGLTAIFTVKYVKE